MITPNEIKERLKREPFHPFTLYSSDGKEYKIVHPEQAWVNRWSLFIALPGSDSNGELPLPDFMKPMAELSGYTAQVAIMRITRMEVHEDEQPKS